MTQGVQRTMAACGAVFVLLLFPAIIMVGLLLPFMMNWPAATIQCLAIGFAISLRRMRFSRGGWDTSMSWWAILRAGS
ncbi:hypothetical protein B8W69_11265 [Mycobacterium vulneris]|uniref:Uncharacterized protein n=2 Tax=Mycolicibacterium vulneris TaxID=547163 RepID=A0A1X2L303_9MYCO|nr:hypothetical protein B8W69_11265 [Mycolicibacterium vulneris]